VLVFTKLPSSFLHDKTVRVVLEHTTFKVGKTKVIGKEALDFTLKAFV